MRLEDPRDLETRVRALRCELAGDRVILAGIRVLLALERRAHFDPAQPRDELGRWAEIGRSTTYPITDPNAETDPAPKDERIRVAGPFDWGLVDLRLDEAYQAPNGKNPHTIRDHVGKSDDALIFLVKGKASNPDGGGSPYQWSSFSSLAAANKIVNSMLSQRPDVVVAVATGVDPGATFEADFAAPVGRHAFTYSPQSQVILSDAYAVRVVIRHRSDFPRGFVVHTAFPIKR